MIQNRPNKGFDDAERGLIEQARQVLSAAGGGENADQWVAEIDQHLLRLNRLWESVEGFPSLFESSQVGGKTRDIASLVTALSSSDPYTVDIKLPTKGVLSEAFLRAAFNFWRMLRYAVEDGLGQVQPGLFEAIDTKVRGSLHMLLIQEILLSVATDEKQVGDIRRKATLVLAHLWEGRLPEAGRRFLDILLTAWEAKRSVRVTYGTLTGSSEIMTLMQTGCDPDFLDYFTRPGIFDEEAWALREFIFNATYEEQQVMLETMKREGLSQLGADDICRIFNVPKERLHVEARTPTDMLFTFRERQSWAEHRRMRGLAGPKRTAEAYAMIHWLAKYEENDLTPERNIPGN